ncbi:MAG TPA: ABC transporter permease subunit/CPBP intramembrane protease [Candidatus Limnocylindrales bacterium]|nr:ABC transporter permease subunit/CPBP intramembrane protease [Candidatus Limnocylindrales bacterium]
MTPVRWSAVSAVFRAELRSVLRDRRTMVATVLVPVLLYPLGGLGFASMAVSSVDRMQSEKTVVCLRGEPEDRAAIEPAFTGSPHIVLHECSGADAEVGHGIDAKIEVPAGSAKKLAEGDAIDLMIATNSRDFRGKMADDRITNSLLEHAKTLIAQRLVAKELPAGFARPIRMLGRDVAPRQQAGAFQWAPLVIVVLILLSVLGVFIPSIDVTAGDRERNTLETLLASPATATELVLGKYGVVFVVGVVSVLLNVTSMFGTVQAISASNPEAATIPVGRLQAGLVMLAAIPSVALSGAICMAVGCLARSFRDAQNYMTPVYLAIILPSYAAAMPTLKLTAFTATIPMLNLPLTLKDVFTGSLDPRLAMLGVLVNVFFVGVALVAASRLYGNEAIAFADAEPMDLLKRPSSATLRFTTGEAISVFGVSAALTFYVGVPLMTRRGSLGLFLVQSLCIFLPPVAWALWRRLESRTAFALRAPGWKSAAAALIIGAVAWIPIQLYVYYVQESVMPIPREVEKGLRDLIAGEGVSVPLMVLLGAALPAIAEETLFRGAILQSLRPAFGRGAIVLTALGFALMHFDPWRLAPTFLLGIVAGALVVRTGSIWTAMIFHFVNNALAIGLTVAYRETETADTSAPPLWLIAVVLAAIPAAWWLLRSPPDLPRKTAPAP